MGEKIDSKATDELQNIENAAQSLQQMLKTQAQETAQGLVDRAIMPFLSKDQKEQIARAQSLAQINQAFTSAEATIAYLQNNGMLSEEEAEQMRSRMQPYGPKAREAYVDAHMAAVNRDKENADAMAKLTAIDLRREMNESFLRLSDDLTPDQKLHAKLIKEERENRYWQQASTPRQKKRDDMLRLMQRYDDEDRRLTEKIDDPTLTSDQKDNLEKKRKQNQRRKKAIER